MLPQKSHISVGCRIFSLVSKLCSFLINFTCFACFRWRTSKVKGLSSCIRISKPASSRYVIGYLLYTHVTVVRVRHKSRNILGSAGNRKCCYWNSWIVNNKWLKVKLWHNILLVANRYWITKTHIFFDVPCVEWKIVIVLNHLYQMVREVTLET